MRRIERPLCDRAELPGELEVTRTAGPFHQDTIPDGLCRDHVVAEGRLVAGDHQPIPPGVAHHMVAGGPAAWTSRSS